MCFQQKMAQLSAGSIWEWTLVAQWLILGKRKTETESPRWCTEEVCWSWAMWVKFWQICGIRVNTKQEEEWGATLVLQQVFTLLSANHGGNDAEMDGCPFDGNFYCLALCSLFLISNGESRKDVWVVSDQCGPQQLDFRDFSAPKILLHQTEVCFK